MSKFLKDVIKKWKANNDVNPFTGQKISKKNKAKNYFDIETQIIEMVIDNLKGKTIKSKEGYDIKIGHVLGSGGFGQILTVEGVFKNYIIKLESYYSKGIQKEEEIYNLINYNEEYNDYFLDENKMTYLPFASFYEAGEFKYLGVPLKYMLIERLDSSLYDKISTKPSIYEALVWLKPVFQGLKYLNSMNISHNDIKPENIVLDKKGNSFIVDFGLAKFYEDDIAKDYAIPDPYYKLGTRSFSGTDYQRNVKSLTIDLESVLYTLMDLILRKLPWSDVRDANSVFQMKKDLLISPREYLKNSYVEELPEILLSLFDEIKPLTFNYEKIMSERAHNIEKGKVMKVYDRILSKINMFLFNPKNAAIKVKQYSLKSYIYIPEPPPKWDRKNPRIPTVSECEETTLNPWMNILEKVQTNEIQNEILTTCHDEYNVPSDTSNFNVVKSLLKLSTYQNENYNDGKGYSQEEYGNSPQVSFKSEGDINESVSRKSQNISSKNKYSKVELPASSPRNNKSKTRSSERKNINSQHKSPQNIILTKEDCLEFSRNQEINPITKRKIKIGGKVHQDLLKKCQLTIDQNPSPTRKIYPKQRISIETCLEFEQNPNVNPITKRKIKIGSKVHRNLETQCREIIDGHSIKLNSPKRKNKN